ncbi:MAG: flagellar protein FlgN [Gammaproteobacteria bacterium]|nr:flagellar protein FlgN [Gammaproteobacteria bacterium]
MTLVSNTQQQEISQLLQTEVDCVNSLLESLHQEYEALAEQHAEALEIVVRDKQEKIQQLESITRQREKLLNSLSNVSVTIDQKNNKHYIFRDDKKSTALWDELVNVAEKCRDKNRVNGSIVETASRQSQHALDILRGILPNASSTVGLYDNSGHTKAFNNKHSLVHV